MKCFLAQRNFVNVYVLTHDDSIGSAYRRAVDASVYEGVYVVGPARSLGVRFSSHVHAKPSQRQNGERANEPASRGEARMRPAYVYTGPSLRRSFLFPRPSPGNISRVILPREER